MAFADNLRRLRRERFWSVRELAKRSGVSWQSIWRYENSLAAPMSRTVRALAEALEVQPRELASPDEVAEARARGKVAVA